MPYINTLDLEERISFLSILAALGQVDGAVKKEEARYLSVAARAYDIPEEKLEEVLDNGKTRDIREMSEALSDPVEKRYLIREMFCLAVADGHVDDEEQDMIFDLGSHLGISEERMEDMLFWAQESWELQNEGARLVEEDVTETDDVFLDDEE